MFSQIDFERILNNLIVDIESNLDLDFVRENNVMNKGNYLYSCIHQIPR